MTQLLDFHPLQRLPAPSRGLSALLHIASLASFAFSFRHLMITENPINDSYGWHFQFLTIIGLVLSTITFTIGLLSDITLSPALFTIKNYLTITSAPLEILISLLYWGLRAIDPKLVLPDWAPSLDPIVDLSFHAVPSAVLLVDVLFFSPPWTVSVVPATGISSSIALGYWFWVEECYRHNKFYPYPIFDEVGPTGRVLLFGASAVTMTLGVITLQAVHGYINGTDVPGTIKSNPKKTKKRQ